MECSLSLVAFNLLSETVGRPWALSNKDFFWVSVSSPAPLVPLSRVLSLSVPSFLIYKVACYLTHSESSESEGALHPAFPTQLCWECKLLCKSDGHPFLLHNWDSIFSAVNLQTGEEMKAPVMVSIWNELKCLHLLVSGSLDLESEDLALPHCQLYFPYLYNGHPIHLSSHFAVD